MAEHSCAYEIFLAGSAERAWDALTTPDMTAGWWAHRNVSDWRVGSRWEHRRLDPTAACDVAGEVVASERPALLALTWANPEDGTPVAGPPAPAGAGSGARLPSLVTFALEPHAAIVRLRVTHERLATAAEASALLAGWAAVLSNLKSWLETGAPLPTAPWDMLPDFVR
jgi:uncharacterized protein YndB with AHSA1/START domain